MPSKPSPLKIVAHWPAVLCLLIDLFVVVLVGLSLHRSYLEYRDRAEVVASNLSQVLDEALVGIVDKIDIALSATVDEFEREQAAGAVDGKAIEAYLGRQRARLPQLQALRIADAGGTLVHGEVPPATRLPNVADRDYFVRLRDDPGAGLVISKPLHGRVTGVDAIVLARRLVAPDGSFAGVVLAVISLQSFVEAFATLDVGPHGTVSLRDGDYTLIVRYPPLPADAPAARRAPSREFRRRADADPDAGTFTAAAGTDDVERTFSYRRFAHHELYVMVGLATGDYLAAWRREAAEFSGLALLFCLITGTAAPIIQRSWRQRGALLHDAEVSSARLKAVLQHSRIGLAIVGLDRIIQLANGAMGEMFGAHDRPLVGRSVGLIHGSRAQFEDLGRRAYPLIMAGGTFTGEMFMLRQDGGAFWCRLSGRLLDAATPSLGVAWVAEDITERKRNDQQLALYRSLIEYTSDCVYVISPRQGFRMVFANDAACSHYGVPRERLLTWRIPDWDMQFSSEEALDELWAQVKEKKSILLQTRHRVHSAAVVPVEMSVNYLLHEGEEFIAGYFHDTVARMTSERALMEKSQELARSNTELEQFAYVASHDLREPLRMVSSYLGLLERRYADKLDDDAREFISFARDGAQRMDRLILDLLDYSRIGRVTRPLEAVPLAEVMDEVALMLKARLAEAGGTLEIGADLPVIEGDRPELVRLFQNLVGNALKYHAPDRPPVVRIAATRRRQEWIIAVADNGIGIAPQYFERIFGIFQRLHARHEYDGTGIGLAICKKIVEHHQGRIWLQSRPGEGSEFFVVLPGAHDGASLSASCAAVRS